MAMVNRGSGSVVEGRSHTRPPYFDGSNYGTWKLKMKIFIQSQDRLLWRIIVKGFNYPTKKIDDKDVVKGEEEFDFEEGKLFDLNVRAINIYPIRVSIYSIYGTLSFEIKTLPITF